AELVQAQVRVLAQLQARVVGEGEGHAGLCPGDQVRADAQLFALHHRAQCAAVAQPGLHGAAHGQHPGGRRLHAQ
ncbi:hypothetical protein B8W90_13560, partial [Staphylococcus hominis]